MPRVNLLPWREELRQKRKKEFLISVGAAVGMGAAVAFTAWWIVDQQIQNQELRNQTLVNEITMLEEQIAEINDLEAQKERLLARMRIIEQLQQSRPGIVHLFDELVAAIPEGAYLTNVEQTDTRLELSGITNSTTRVATLMRNIEASDWLNAPQLGSIEAVGNDPTNRNANFVVRATQRNVDESSDVASAAPAPGAAQ